MHGHVHLRIRTLYAPAAHKLHVTTPKVGMTPVFTGTDIPPVLSSGDNCPALMAQLEGQRLPQHLTTGSGSSQKHSYNRSVLRFKSKSADEISGVLILRRTGTMGGKGAGPKKNPFLVDGEPRLQI